MERRGSLSSRRGPAAHHGASHLPTSGCASGNFRCRSRRPLTVEPMALIARACRSAADCRYSQRRWHGSRRRARPPPRSMRWRPRRSSGIATMGDSYASGEGAPDVRRPATTPTAHGARERTGQLARRGHERRHRGRARHRSRNAPSALAAGYLSRGLPRPVGPVHLGRAAAARPSPHRASSRATRFPSPGASCARTTARTTSTTSIRGRPCPPSPRRSLSSTPGSPARSTRSWSESAATTPASGRSSSNARRSSPQSQRLQLHHQRGAARLPRLATRPAPRHERHHQPLRPAGRSDQRRPPRLRRPSARAGARGGVPRRDPGCPAHVVDRLLQRHARRPDRGEDQRDRGRGPGGELQAAAQHDHARQGCASMDGSS